MMAAPVKAGASFNVGAPAVLFEGRPDRRYLDAGYDVGADGRFVMVQRDPEAPPPQVRVVLNWFEELRAKMR
jgi:hypothetical protein